MPKYLVAASYTAEGVKGLLKDGGSARRAAVEAALKSIGGKLESFYFTFGDTDAFAIVEAADNATAAALALATGAAGLVRTTTTVLITPEKMEIAAKKNVTYRAPGK